MKSRIAVTLMLVLGMGLSTTGAGLAVTGSSSQDDAARAVYEQPQGGAPLGPSATAAPTPGPAAASPPAPASTPATPKGEVLSAPEAQEEAGEVRGVESDSAESAPVAPVRVAEQAEVADTTVGDSLPFTGFSAIPVLLAGLALMAGGMLMHRRTRAGSL